MTFCKDVLKQCVLWKVQITLILLDWINVYMNQLSTKHFWLSVYEIMRVLTKYRIHIFAYKLH